MFFVNLALRDNHPPPPPPQRLSPKLLDDDSQPNHVQSLSTLYTVYSTCVQGRSSVYNGASSSRRRLHAASLQLDYDSSWRTLGLTEQLTLREDVSRQVPIAHDGKYLFFLIPRLADWGEVCWFTKLAEECRYKNATKINHDFLPNDGPIP